MKILYRQFSKDAPGRKRFRLKIDTTVPEFRIGLGRRSLTLR